MALFPAGVNLQQARQLLQDRPRSGWNSVAAFLALPLYSKAIPPPPARG
jgi:general secretion pathway protein K